MKENNNKMTQESIAYGTRKIDFELQYKKRKTLGITVHPDLKVEVRAPEDANRKEIFEKVRKRASWIVEQQRFFLAFESRGIEYVYKSGESHYYLGRQYLLKIVNGTAEEVFYRGRDLLIETQDKNPENIKKLLEHWYRSRAKLKFPEYAEPFIQRFERKYDVSPNKLYIQKMEKRWGSCSSQGNIILNPELIKAPKACIEYVINHELCHLVHRNHNKAFFDLQNQEMPDWRKWKEKLEVFMAGK